MYLHFMDYYDLNKNKTFLVSLKAFIKKENKLLVIKFPDSNKTEWVGEWNGTWGLPGGLLEMNEDIRKGLAREILEETGLKVKLVKILAVGNYMLNGFIFKDKRKMDTRIIELGFLCEYLGGNIILGNEHSKYKWVTKSELSKLIVSPDSRELIQQYLKNK